MSEQTDKLNNLLISFGLSEDEASIYLVLVAKGVLSALTISRELRMGRTKVYRVLDKLLAKGLVLNKYDEAGFKFVASEPTKLELLLNQREGELTALKQALPKMAEELEQLKNRERPGSKVLYYQGKRGLSQVNFNLLRAKGEICSYEVSNAEAYMDHQDAEEMRRELVKAKIFIRSITNLTKFEPFTEVGELWQPRWIDPAEFEIKADVFIYNDVYALCHYLGDDDIFCVEMYNQKLADMQKQLFEHLWRTAKPLTVINARGEAVLE